MQTSKSEELFRKAKQCFPGGVNSPVRAFGSVGGTPLFIQRGERCFIFDVDGNKYIDFCGSWGPLILGHAHPKVIETVAHYLGRGLSFGAPTALENELAELILSNNSFIQKLRFVSSGTEAVMSAIRLARGYSGKSLIVKFEGCYHGHHDSLLVKAGSGLSTFGISSSAGVPESVSHDTLVLPLKDRKILEETISKNKSNLAAVIIEPIPANNGLLLQDKEYLQFLRDVTAEHNVLLIFDEVISGFRVGFTGAAGYYNIQPDIITYGKIIGGGMPVGAYGANEKIMSKIAPDGNVYQAGTLSGNPIAMAAGIATLSECIKPGFYESLKQNTAIFVNTINAFALQNDIGFKVFSIGSIFWFAFTEKEKIQSASDINPDRMQIFKKFYHELLSQGIYLGPSGYEVGFISSVHHEDTLREAAEKICSALTKVI